MLYATLPSVFAGMSWHFSRSYGPAPALELFLDRTKKLADDLA
jgi:hypothetical protein